MGSRLALLWLFLVVRSVLYFVDQVQYGELFSCFERGGEQVFVRRPLASVQLVMQVEMFSTTPFISLVRCPKRLCADCSDFHEAPRYLIVLVSNTVELPFPGQNVPSLALVVKSPRSKRSRPFPPEPLQFFN